MTETTVGIIDPFHPAIIDTIRAALPGGWALSIAETGGAEDRTRALATADAAFVMATPMPASLLASAPRLRFIQKLGAGVDRINAGYCREHGIGLARLQAGNHIPVAEHTLMLMLAACRQLPALDARTRSGSWEKEAVRGTNRHLNGKTVGIVGLGAVGKQVARLLNGFGVRLLYSDPVAAPAEWAAAFGAERCDLDRLLAEADVVTLHLPLKEDTRDLIDGARIAAMKPGAILINAARGGVVDEAALAEALRDGRLFAAGLDVFASEPPGPNPLFDLPNTVITPHCAGATVDNFASVARRAVENTLAALAGEALDPAEVVVPPVRLQSVEETR